MATLGRPFEGTSGMSEQFHDELFWVYESFKRTKEVSILTDFIRAGGLINTPWPVGLSEDLADMLDNAYPRKARKQTQIDDTWIFYVYWRETEFKSGKPDDQFNMAVIRYIEEWFEALGTPKKYQTIRTRLRENYRYWRNNLTPIELDKMIESAGGGEKS